MAPMADVKGCTFTTPLATPSVRRQFGEGRPSLCTGGGPVRISWCVLEKEGCIAVHVVALAGVEESKVHLTANRM